jgi:2-isopropylmalate synthase
MKPEDIGRTDSRIVISKHSGRNAFRNRLQELGYSLNDDEFMRAFRAFKEIADKKKDVTDSDIEAVVADQVLTVEETYRLEHLQVTCGEPAVPVATVRIATPDGEVLADAAIGDGPVDAVYRAIDRLVGVPTKLSDFSVQSVSSGMDALGEVQVKVETPEGTFLGRGASTDIIVASGKAYLNALNKAAAARRERESGAPSRRSGANGASRADRPAAPEAVMVGD